MKDFSGIILLILGTLVAVIISIGIVTAIQKSFSTVPQTEDAAATSRQRLEQKQRVDAINEQQKKLMEEQKQKLRDFRRNL